VATRIRRRPVLAGILLVLLLVVLFFGGRAAWRLGGRLLGPPPPPRQTDVAQIADWMSVPYIARAYRVPRSELFQALGVESEGRERRSIREIAEQSGRSSEELLAIVRETVRAWQTTHPEPSGKPGPQDRSTPDKQKPTGANPPGGVDG
jgi:hypothetical protein